MKSIFFLTVLISLPCFAQEKATNGVDIESNRIGWTMNSPNIYGISRLNEYKEKRQKEIKATLKDKTAYPELDGLYEYYEPQYGGHMSCDTCFVCIDSESKKMTYKNWEDNRLKVSLPWEQVKLPSFEHIISISKEGKKIKLLSGKFSEADLNPGYSVEFSVRKDGTLKVTNEYPYSSGFLRKVAKTCN